MTTEASQESAFYKLHNDSRKISVAETNAPATADFAQLLFENGRIQVFDFRLPPNQSLLIRHDMATIRWQVDEGCHSLVVEENAGTQQAREETVEDRTVFFVHKGTTWKLTNTGTTTYRQSVFAIKSDRPKYTQEHVQALFDQAIFSTNVGTALLFENELVRCWDFYLEPGEGGGADTVHHHCLDYVFINVAPSRLLGLHPETLDLENLLFDSISQDNQVTWNTIPETAPKDKSFAHGGKNGYDDRPMREYLIELK